MRRAVVRESEEEGNRGGPAEIRTLDPQLARLMLYQLSYWPTIINTRNI
jgi:hypothetical protein